MTKIEWTDETWNPVTGCTKISPGCKHCYADRMATRLQGMGHANYANGFRLTLQPHMLTTPLEWRQPRMIFVNSMSDLFHTDVPLEYIKQVFGVMKETPQHTYQVLTKRAERLSELAPLLEWTPNIWMGVSVENQEYANKRIPHLLRTPAAVRFLSCEPLLGELDLTNICIQGGEDSGEFINSLNLEEFGSNGVNLINWVIAGGESGPSARPMNPEWVRSLRDQCNMYQVPFFFKQWGGVNKKRAGRLLDGRTWDEMPRKG